MAKSKRKSRIPDDEEIPVEESQPQPKSRSKAKSKTKGDVHDNDAQTKSKSKLKAKPKAKPVEEPVEEEFVLEEPSAEEIDFDLEEVAAEEPKPALEDDIDLEQLAAEEAEEPAEAAEAVEEDEAARADEPEEALDEEAALDDEDDEAEEILADEEAEEALAEDDADLEAAESAEEEDAELQDEEEALDEETELEDGEEALDEETALEDDDEALAEKDLDEDAEEETPDEDADEAAAEEEELLMKDREEEEEAKEEATADEKKPARPAPPQPQLSKTAIAFILLNWIVVPAFLTVAYLDHVARLQFAYRAVLNHIAVWGLPLREEEEFTSLSTDTRPHLRLSPEQLREAFKSRRGVAQVPPREEFVAVDEPVPLRVRPSDMRPEILKDVFWDLPNPQATLEDEMEYEKKTVPAAIENAAKEVADKLKADKASDDAKRDVIRKVFLPIAWDVWHIKKLEDKIVSAKGDDLDKLVNDCVQRRFYYDILAPINVFRPGNLAKFTVEKLGDLDAYELDEVKKVLVDRFSAAAAEQHNLEVHLGELWNTEKTGADAMKRHSIEKRQSIGFIMFALSQVQTPTIDKDGVKFDKKLFAKGVERAQTVSGMKGFTNASIFYVRARRILEERLVDAIMSDRGGRTFTDKGGKIDRTEGYIETIDREIDRLVHLKAQIDAAKGRLADLQTQKDHLLKLFDQRAAQHKEALDKLLTSRKNSEKYIKDLRELQDQLHAALVELSDAAERNFALEAKIRKMETDLLKQMNKGGKK